jgi:hypothetical protein
MTRTFAFPAGIALVAVAGAVLALGARPERPSLPRREPFRAAPLSHQDCQSCHPRQTAEWRRSVMAYAAHSPLFQALELVIQEQVGRDRDCPEGAGVLRGPGPSGGCREPFTGLPVTGSGGANWCVNCHAPLQNLVLPLPSWDGLGATGRARRSLRDLMTPAALEGIGCLACHAVSGPASPRLGGYQGNPFWTSIASGTRFEMRPEDRRGLFGIANSGYFQDLRTFLAEDGDGPAELVPGGVHRRMSERQRSYLGSSEFCGACHDVRLFGTDVLGAAAGEHFKRLRNGYSEWRAYAERERSLGRRAATCQDCHMSAYPGVCISGGALAADEHGCPDGTRFSPQPPASPLHGLVSTSSNRMERVHSHYFSGVDVPLASEFSAAWISDETLDTAGIPLGARQRRNLLLRSSARLEIGEIGLRGGLLEVPIKVENVGAGHRIPAGFSQERELWLHVRISDRRGRVTYEAGRVDRDDEDLRDKIFVRVTTSAARSDERGRALGLFGADVADGPDLPRWRELRTSKPPSRSFAGRGLVNFQNGFLRCVRCIGVIARDGSCRPGPGQGLTRADRYEDGDYDPDTGACRSNLAGGEALFETYFPVGGLDAGRGVLKAPDAIIDTRSLPPGIPLEYVHELAVDRGAGPFRVEARLMFRAFPPFLIRAFAAYEAEQAALGRRPSGPLIDPSALERIEVVELERAVAEGP